MPRARRRRSIRSCSLKQNGQMRARIVMRLAAGAALLEQQLALRGRSPEGLGLRVDAAAPGSCGPVHRRHRLLPFHDQGGAAVARAEQPPVPCASARSQFFTCTAGCASPRSWRTASMTLVMPPRLAGWLLHSPPPSVLNGSLPTARDQVAVGDEPAALALLAEAEVLELHQHGDREAVVDRGVLDVGRRDAGLGEGARARTSAAPE